jgi:hypothetical protein
MHAATQTAASCSTSDVQAAVNAASDGDTVIIPGGSCTWTSGISTTKQIQIQGQNYTSTPGGRSTQAVIIVNNSTTGPLFEFTSGNTYHVGVTGIRFNEGTGSLNHLRFNGTGSKVPLVNDCYFEIKNRFGNEPDIDAIAWLSQGGVMWNTWIQGVGGGNAQCCPEGSSIRITSPRPWESASTMGSLDTNGTVNVYVEDSTWKDFGASPNIDDNGRFVMRHSLLDGVSGLTHGFTSTKGGRHAEYYDNTFTTTSDNRNIAGRYFWLRAGTIIFTDNVVNAQNVGYGTPFLVGIGDIVAPTGYPMARQPGWGHDGTNSVIDPIYLWNNTGAGAYLWAVYDPWGSNVQLNREIFVNSGAKPGYAKYTYPHPARTETPTGPGPSPNPPTNVSATVH